MLAAKIKSFFIREKDAHEKVRELFIYSDKEVITAFSVSHIQFMMNDGMRDQKREYPCLFVTSRDYTNLRASGKFDSFFDPQNLHTQLVKGHVGSMFGAFVVSDVYYDPRHKFLTDSYVVYARRNDLLSIFRK